MKLPLHWSILIALIAAVVVGSLFGDSEAVVKACSVVGALFLNALKMLIVPLILSALMNGLIGGAEQGGLGRLGALTFGFYIGSGLLAILTGLAWANTFDFSCPRMLSTAILSRVKPCRKHAVIALAVWFNKPSLSSYSKNSSGKPSSGQAASMSSGKGDSNLNSCCTNCKACTTRLGFL